MAPQEPFRVVVLLSAKFASDGTRIRGMCDILPWPLNTVLFAHLDVNVPSSAIATPFHPGSAPVHAGCCIEWSPAAGLSSARVQSSPKDEHMAADGQQEANCAQALMQIGEIIVRASLFPVVLLGTAASNPRRLLV